MSELKIPEEAIVSAIEFAKQWSRAKGHCEAVQMCAHCNISFLATWTENLLSDLLRSEAELARLQTALQAAQEEIARLKMPVSDEEWRECFPDAGKHGEIYSGASVYRESVDDIIAARTSQGAGEGGEVVIAWQCERCGEVYAEYVNGCPACWRGKLRSLGWLHSI